jgi:hypothetical protein
MRWLEHKKRREQSTAAVLSVLALGGGTAVFLFTTLLIYAVLSFAGGAFFSSVILPGLIALGLAAGLYAHSMRSRKAGLDLHLDPMGFWIIEDICSVGPRLILEGMRQVRCREQLGQLNVAVCARALAYLAAQNRSVSWEELIRHCPQPSGESLRRQLSLIDGVLFLGKDAASVTLMDPFRLWLRSMLKQEQQTAKQEWQEGQPRPEPSPEATPLNDPEKLGAYEILGLSPSASLIEIKTAYRKRMKACHPDLFTGMDPRAKALAERWTRALNAAYATLNPRGGNRRSQSARQAQ